MHVGTLRLVSRAVRTRPAYRGASFLRDPAVHRSLRDHGYCVTDHFVSPEAVEFARETVESHPFLEELDAPGHVHSLRGFGPPDMTLEQRIAIDARFRTEVQQIAHQGAARATLAAVQVKPSSPRSVLLVHQDYFLVDEAEVFGLNAWICLTDADEDAGPLYVVPGSHKFGNWQRITSHDDDFVGLHDVISRHGRVLPSKAGQIVLLDHALIHGSLPNASGSRRIAISCHVIPNDADRKLQCVTDDTPPGYVDFTLTAPDILDRGEPGVADRSRFHREPVDDLALTPRKLDLACRAHAVRHGNPPGLAGPIPTHT